MNELLTALAVPFPLDLIEFKPGATQAPSDGGNLGKALGLAYVDPRHYSERLNAAAGTGWGDSYSLFPLGDRLITICSLTIDGVTRTGDGECLLSDPNCMTVSSAQAFKRSCVKWGLGAALYDAPQTWAEAKFGQAKGNGKAPCYGFTDTGLAQLRRAFGGPAPVAAPAKPAAKPAPPSEEWEDDADAILIADFGAAIAGAATLDELKKIGDSIKGCAAPVGAALRTAYLTRQGQIIDGASKTVKRGSPALVN